VTKDVLPASHVQLRRALDREARAHVKRHRELNAAGSDGAENRSDGNGDCDEAAPVTED
jgi:hypothetical protein